MNKLYKVHDGCAIDLTKIIAIWSERYSDPKLDSECYLVRVFLKNNSTMLTIAAHPSKAKADELIKEISEMVK